MEDFRTESLGSESMCLLRISQRADWADEGSEARPRGTQTSGDGDVILGVDAVTPEDRHR